MYELFINETVDKVSEILGDTYKVELKKVTKNNGVIYDTICILEEGNNISPTIYLNQFFNQFVAGRRIKDIAETIVSIHRENAVSSFDTTSFLDFEKTKYSICYKLVNTKKNAKLLADCPSRSFLDLSIIYYVHVDNIEGCIGSIVIHNSHMKAWGVTEEDLYNAASINTQRIRPLKLKDLCEAMFEISHNEDDLHMGCFLYILSAEKTFGAAALLYDDAVNLLSSTFKCNLWLIPSSTEEWLIMPDHIGTDYNDIKKMIIEVNSTNVADEEVLSDHPYYFNYETKEITLEE